MQTFPAHAAAFALNTDGSFSYTPNANAAACADSFTYSASDGELSSNAATVSITVNPVNDNPTAVDDSATVTEDSGANTINVLGNDDIAPDTGETLTVTAVTQGAHGSAAISNGGANVSYTPNANFSGSDSFTYTISDGNGGTASGSVNITVTAVNDAPTIVSGTITRQQNAGTSNSQIAAVNDIDDAENNLVVTVNNSTSATAGGVTISNLAVDSAGVVTADVSAACGASNATFTLKVTDPGNLSATAALNVTVTAETTPPVINPISNVVVELPANSNAASMVVNFSLPTASDNCSTPTVTTDPVSGSEFPFGTTTVNVTAADAAGNMATSSFTVTVLYRFSWFSYGGVLFNETILNQVTAGSDVPVRFTLSGYKGNPYSSPPTSEPISCSTFASTGAATVTNRYAPDPFYSATFDFYQTTWKTQASWKFTCRRLKLYLTDGTTKSLNFYFK